VQVTTSAAGATWQGGFLRAPTGELVVTSSPASPSWQAGFLRDGNGALVVNNGGTGSFVGGWVRDASGAIVVGSTATGVSGGFSRTAAGGMAVSGLTAETFGLLAPNGAWTWFNDPRAIVDTGVLYAGMVTQLGDIKITATNISTGAIATHTLSAQLEADDHDNPGIWIRPDGRIVCFYSKHSTDSLIRFRVSTNPRDITAWGSEVSNAFTNVAGTNGFAYNNPHYLSAESRVYNFSRGAGLQPVISYSTDQGATWQASKVLFAPPASVQRPYIKYVSNGVDRIDFWATNGHPNELAAAEGDIFHFYYSATDGLFHKTDGTAGKSLATVMAGTPLDATDATKVHTAATEGGGGNGNGWTWSIEYDATGKPVVTYAVFVAAGDNRYRYARWDGSAWVKSGDMLTGQPSLYDQPYAPAGGDAEMMYSGGIVVDPRDTSQVYLANHASGQYEIERWTSPDGGLSWPSRTAITAGSTTKNFRPYCPRNWSTGAPAVLWCRGVPGAPFGGYNAYVDFQTDVYGSPAPAPAPQSALLSDTFTESAAQLLQDHISDSGHRWIQHPKGPLNRGTVSAGRLRPALTTGSVVYYSDWVPASADYRASAPVTQQSALGNFGVMVRCDPLTNTWYFARFNSTGAVWQLFRVVVGVTTQLGSNVAGSVGTLDLDAVGNTLTVRVNGSPLAGLNALVDPSPIVAKGFAGVQGAAAAGGATDTTGIQLDSVTTTNL
jgi:hypothetical protein